MKTPPKEEIEREARAAAEAGTPLREACYYPFSSEAGKHFIAAYLVAVPVSTKDETPK